MAAKALFPEDELCCSVCCDIFKEPVLLKCSHSFCKECLKQYWKEKRSRECPICRRKASTEEPPKNLALRNIAESYLKQKTETETAEKSEVHCSLHGEKIVLFCEQDKEPLCVICQTSKKHRTHSLCPVEEAVQDLKDELKSALNEINKQFKRFAGVGEECKKTAKHIRSYQSIRERAQCSLQDPELLSGALIDAAKHLGNLKFRVWGKMLEMVQYTPVTLDPNTACASLSLSDNLTSVRDTDRFQKCSDNPERFNSCVSVLGSEGFTSGKHSWEVKVGNKPEWHVGVMKESSNRKGDITCSPKGGYWVLQLRNGDEYIAPGGTRLKLERKPQSIRVQLDYDRGRVSFFNSSDMSLIYTFKDTFTERMFPYFSPSLKGDGNDEPLQICPVKVSVTVTSLQ